MKVCFKNIDNSITSKQINVIKEFVKFVQTHLPLKKDVYINFLPDRSVKMTTGVRFPKGEIFVLSGNRLLIDILRTLSHEWVQKTMLKFKTSEDLKKICVIFYQVFL
jgi:hypothetical protein